MRCLVCEKLSPKHICFTCQTSHLAPSLYKRRLPNNIEVLSFYKYKEIKELLFTKHTDLGFHVYKILAERSFKKFSQNFNFDERVISLAIDDQVQSGYSHTAILNKQMKTKTLLPLYHKLRATNAITYSGKSREYRLLNSRDFMLKSFKGEYVVLVDDIITTGSTLMQACHTLEQAGKEVLFCLTLCDVDQE